MLDCLKVLILNNFNQSQKIWFIDTSIC